MPNIADQLDAAIGAAPSDAPGLDATLVLGRRALRRRRLAYAAGATAGAVVIGGTAWAVSPGDGGAASDRELQIGNTSTSSPTSDSEPPVDRRGDTAEPWAFGREAAALMEDGTLITKPGWEVVDLIEEPSGPNTVAVDVRNGDDRQWFLWSGAGTLHVPRAPDRDYASFDDWVTINGPTMTTEPGSGRHRRPAAGQGARRPGRVHAARAVGPGARDPDAPPRHRDHRAASWRRPRRRVRRTGRRHRCRVGGFRGRRPPSCSPARWAPARPSTSRSARPGSWTRS